MDNLHAVKKLSALSSEPRLMVFRYLVQKGKEGAPAGDIAQVCDIPSSTLSHHLQQMHSCGLLLRQRQSRSLIYCVDFTGMKELIDFLTQDCCNGHPELCC